MEYFFGTLFGLALAVFAVCGMSEQAGTGLQWWAERQGLHLLNWECRWIRQGPFQWRMGGQQVFRFVAKNSSGQIRKGHLRIPAGDVDKAEVAWDK